MIVLPGIFNRAISAHSKQAYFDLVDAGYHVIVVPNPWSETFVRGGSGVKPGNFMAEADLIYNFIDEVRFMIPSELVTSTHLMGASYGGFLAAVIAEKDSREKERMFDGTITIFSPPIKLDDSLELLDSLTSEVGSEKPKMNWVEKMLLVTDMMFTQKGSRPDSPALQVSSVFVLQVGFKENLRNLLQILNETYDLKWSNREIEETGFKRYFETYAKDVRNATKRRNVLLNYWVNRAVMNNSHVRVLTTENDFINTPRALRSLHLNRENLLTLPSGGHMGYFAFDWYEAFKKVIF